MSRDTQELLAECESNAKELVTEIENYKQAVAYNKSLAKSLDGIVTALKKVSEEIAPYSEESMASNILFMKVGLGINAALLVLVLIIK